MELEATFARPMKATLVVRYADGTEETPTAEHLDEFGLISTQAAYIRFNTVFSNAMRQAGVDVTHAHLNPLRYLAEVAIMYRSLGDVIEHADSDIDESEDPPIVEQIAELERSLRAAHR